MKKMLGYKSIKFEAELEEEYSKHISFKDIKLIRFAFVLFVVLYALFSWTDYTLVPQWFDTFFVIRFYIVIPTMLATIAFSFHPNFYRIKQQILLFNFMLGGFGVATMLIVEPLNIIYYGGLFLVLTSGYFILNLSFHYSIIGGFSILIYFILGIILFSTYSLIISGVILFLIAQNLIGAYGTYHIERFRRNEFLNIHNLGLEQIQLSKMIDEKIKEISETQISTIIALAKLAESRDFEIGEHIERVGEVCFKIAEALPESYFTNESEKKEFCEKLHHASILHDIGKVAIPDNILNKPGTLSDEEYTVMRRHTKIGSGTLAKLHEQNPHNYFIKLGIEITRSHHERWDGKGYPDGLKENEIPLSARIMAISDVYDALISKRPYKAAYSHEQAIEIIKEESGTHFDPAIVKLFLNIFENPSIFDTI